MSQAVIINAEFEDVGSRCVADTMNAIGWDGIVVDVVEDTVYFEGAGNIPIGTSEQKQEELIRQTFNKVLDREINISIFWG